MTTAADALPILHHYDFAPFAERVRLALGLEGDRLGGCGDQTARASWGSLYLPECPFDDKASPLIFP
jgi:hypothetical protein